MRLKKIIKRVGEENKIKIIINELNKISDKKRYNIKMIPALIIDDKIISQGKILSDREVKKLIITTT